MNENVKYTIKFMPGHTIRTPNRYYFKNESLNYLDYLDNPIQVVKEIKSNSNVYLMRPSLFGFFEENDYSHRLDIEIVMIDSEFFLLDSALLPKGLITYQNIDTEELVNNPNYDRDFKNLITLKYHEDNYILLMNEYDMQCYVFFKGSNKYNEFIINRNISLIDKTII